MRFYSTGKFGSRSSIFTSSASLDATDESVRQARPGSGRSLELALGLSFGILALIGVVVAGWLFMRRKQTEAEDPAGDFELSSETTLESTFTCAVDDLQTVYQSQDLDQLIAAGHLHVFSTVFADHSEEADRLI
jgi:hypothetical protein